MIEDFLLAEGLLSREELALVESRRAQVGGTLGQHATALGLVDENALAALLSRRLSVPLYSERELLSARKSALARLSPEVAIEHRAVPVRIEDDNLRVAMADPSDKRALEEVIFFAGMYVLRAVAAESTIDGALAAYYGYEPPTLVPEPVEVGPRFDPQPASGELADLFPEEPPGATVDRPPPSREASGLILLTKKKTAERAKTQLGLGPEPETEVEPEEAVTGPQAAALVRTKDGPPRARDAAEASAVAGEVLVGEISDEDEAEEVVELGTPKSAAAAPATAAAARSEDLDEDEVTDVRRINLPSAPVSTATAAATTEEEEDFDGPTNERGAPTAPSPADTDDEFDEPTDERKSEPAAAAAQDDEFDEPTDKRERPAGVKPPRLAVPRRRRRSSTGRRPAIAFVRPPSSRAPHVETAATLETPSAEGLGDATKWPPARSFDAAGGESLENIWKQGAFEDRPTRPIQRLLTPSGSTLAAPVDEAGSAGSEDPAEPPPSTAPAEAADARARTQPETGPQQTTTADKAEAAGAAKAAGDAKAAEKATDADEAQAAEKATDADEAQDAEKATDADKAQDAEAAAEPTPEEQPARLPADASTRRRKGRSTLPMPEPPLVAVLEAGPPKRPLRASKAHEQAQPAAPEPAAPEPAEASEAEATTPEPAEAPKKRKKKKKKRKKRAPSDAAVAAVKSAKRRRRRPTLKGLPVLKAPQIGRSGDDVVAPTPSEPAADDRFVRKPRRPTSPQPIVAEEDADEALAPNAATAEAAEAEAVEAEAAEAEAVEADAVEAEAVEAEAAEAEAAEAEAAEAEAAEAEAAEAEAAEAEAAETAEREAVEDEPAEDKRSEPPLSPLAAAAVLAAAKQASATAAATRASKAKAKAARAKAAAKAAEAKAVKAKAKAAKSKAARSKVASKLAALERPPGREPEPPAPYAAGGKREDSKVMRLDDLRGKPPREKKAKPAGSWAQSARGLASKLNHVVARLRRAKDDTDLTAAALDFVGIVCERRALLRLKRGVLSGWAAAGNRLDTRAIRGLWLPVDGGSVFGEVVSSRVPYQGPLLFGKSERIFASFIGNHPDEILLVPIVRDDTVVGLIYGDSMVVEVPMPLLRDLAGELAMAERRLRRS